MENNTVLKNKKTYTESQKKRLPYVKAKIDKLVDVENSKLKAFASVTIGGAVAVHNVWIISAVSGLFVAMPSNSYIDSNGEKRFNSIVHPVSKEARELINSKVLQAYNQACKEEYNIDESESATDSAIKSIEQSM